MELSLKKAVDADMFRLRKVRDGLTLGISDLEIFVENLQEELVTLKKNHSEVRAAIPFKAEKILTLGWKSAACPDFVFRRCISCRRGKPAQ